MLSPPSSDSGKKIAVDSHSTMVVQSKVVAGFHLLSKILLGAFAFLRYPIPARDGVDFVCAGVEFRRGKLRDRSFIICGIDTAVVRTVVLVCTCCFLVKFLGRLKFNARQARPFSPLFTAYS